MNWLTDIIRPRIRSLVEPKEVPDDLWQKCPSCEGMLFHRDLKKSHNVCYHCNHHLRLPVKERLAHLFDEGKYEKIELPDVVFDPLKFKDRKKYSDRLKDSRSKTNLKEAITVAKGTIQGEQAVIAAFNFSFMGGSMGAGMGESIVMAALLAVETNSAFIVIPASGGARMQEGMISLMQMPRTIVGVEMVKDAGLPYIVLLSDPTTGGVSASFAMVGDVHIAEPGAMIGFAGRRVIEETVRETLPEDFQTAEYLLEHGMVDMVVPRSEQAETIGRLISLLLNKPPKTGVKMLDGDIKKVLGSHSSETLKRRRKRSRKAPKAHLDLEKKAKLIAPNPQKVLVSSVKASEAVAKDPANEVIHVSKKVKKTVK